MIKYWIAVLFLSIAFMSCSKTDNSPEAPTIGFMNMFTTSVRSGAVEDTVFINLRISDKNGDLGNDPKTGKFDVFLIDSRNTGSIEDTLKLYFPTIPDDIKDPAKGIEGETTIILPASFYFFTRDDHPNGDTLHFDIHIVDKAGHESNRVSTPDIYIAPE